MLLEPGVVEGLFAAVPLLGVDLDHPDNQRLGLLRDVLPVALLKLHLARYDPLLDLRVRLAVERRVAAEQDVQDHPA